MEEAFNPSSDLYHFGIKNMKWGLQRFQTREGKWTPEGLARRREREGFGGDDDRTANGRHSKEEIINSGNVKLVSKYRDELSTDELRSAINRIDTERKLDSLMKDASRPLWQKRAERTMKIVGAASTMMDNAMTWATKGNGKIFVDYLTGKTERDANTARRIKSGDYEWLKAHFSELSLEQQKKATDAMRNRFSFETESWKNENNDSDEKKKKKKEKSGQSGPSYNWNWE